MPEPEFQPADFVDPDAPETQRRIRGDHPSVRDLSYDRSRSRQLLDLYKNSYFDPGFPDESAMLEAELTGQWPARLELYVKEQPRGRHYVADFVYLSHELPVTVYGVLLDNGYGLMVGELELFRRGWGYFDPWGDFIGKEAWDAEQRDRGDGGDGGAGRYTGITTTVLRQIPLGEIVALAQKSLAGSDWRETGVRVLMGPDLAPDELPPAAVSALETATRSAANSARTGRPPLPDALLAEVARAYLDQAPGGRGLRRRLARRFDRPEATIRDWINQARKRGFLTPAQPGRRGAAPGPRLSPSPPPNP